jgi:hypothetical protein
MDDYALLSDTDAHENADEVISYEDDDQLIIDELEAEHLN